MLVHICCSVDSHFFLQKLQSLYPEKELIGFFYNPNIHPYGEYKLRLLDVKRSCKKLGIRLLEGDYNYNNWLQLIKGLEQEPEKGKRCTVCFDNRLEETAKKALQMNINEITTTLLTSPKKSPEQIKLSALQIEKKYPLSVIIPDFRKNGGTNEQFSMARSSMLYHQNYCGCMFALEKQRESQGRLTDEFMAPITAQIQPSSTDDRIDLYKSVVLCEEKNEKFKLIRERFLNYRLLQGLVKVNNEPIDSYILFYSTLLKNSVKAEVNFVENGIGHLTKNEILLVDIERFNAIMQQSFLNVKELMRKPLLVDDELSLRRLLGYSNFPSLNPIIIVDKIESQKYEISIKSKTYTDIREILVKVR